MSNQKKIANAEHKIAISLLKDQKKLPENVNNPQKLQEIDSQIAAMGSGQDSAGYYLELVGAGALAISAMILPGISGSFLLLAMGLYFDILAALSNFNIPVILVFGLGCLLGLLLFSHLLNWLLKRCADQTMGFLTGLMAGSLWTIWPFRTAQIVGEATPYEQLVYLGNRLPASFGANEIITILTTLAGIAVVAFFLGYEKKHAAAAAKSA